MSRRGTWFFGAFPLLALLVGAFSTAHAQPSAVTEEFTTAVPITHGTKLGSCKQFTAGLTAGGAITIANDKATFSTTTAADAAIIYTSTALPRAGYKVSVKVTKVSFPQVNAENAVTLAAVANGLPGSATETQWFRRRIVGVEVDSKPEPEFPDGPALFINYWAKSTAGEGGGDGPLFTWDGSAWNSEWQPYSAFAPLKTSYEVAIEKTATEYVITVKSAGTQLARAVVGIGSAAVTSAEYLVVGDRLTDFSHGTLEIDSITVPSALCTTTVDAGAAPGGEEVRDAGIRREIPVARHDSGRIGEEFPDVDAGGHWYLDLGRAHAMDAASGCDCRVGARAQAPRLLLLALLLAGVWGWWRRRRR